MIVTYTAALILFSSVVGTTGAAVDISVATASETFNLIVCENDWARFNCKSGNIIKIHHSSYGRSQATAEVCPLATAPNDDTNCHESTSFDRVDKYCGDRYQCAFEATNVFFKNDPCGGTYKYLNLTYSCEISGLRMAASCDDDMTLYMDTIETAYSANWLNPRFAIVPPEAEVIGIECVNTKKFGGIIASFNDGRRTETRTWRCTDQYEEGWNEPDFDDSHWNIPIGLGTNPLDRRTVFGIDEAAEWIWVQNETAQHVFCRTSAQETTVTGENLVVCENDHAHFNCKSGKIIKIAGASYGRSESSAGVCAYHTTHNDDTNCHEEESLERVRGFCEDRYQCAFGATNEFFKNDPCYGTYKYLNLTYNCENSGLRMAASCDDNMTLYMDGVATAYSVNWKNPRFAIVPLGSSVVGVECINLNRFGGIIASFNDGRMTETQSWKCSNEYEVGWNEPGFDDSHWASPVSLGTNPLDRVTVFGIDEAAEWIWVEDATAQLVFCRTQL